MRHPEAVLLDRLSTGKPRSLAMMLLERDQMRTTREGKSKSVPAQARRKVYRDEKFLAVRHRVGHRPKANELRGQQATKLRQISTQIIRDMHELNHGLVIPQATRPPYIIPTAGYCPDCPVILGR